MSDRIPADRVGAAAKACAEIRSAVEDWTEVRRRAVLSGKEGKG